MTTLAHSASAADPNLPVLVEPFRDGRASYRDLQDIASIGDGIASQKELMADRVLAWFERRGAETLTKPDGEEPTEPVSYAATIIGAGCRSRMYQLRDWALSRRILSESKCLPGVETLPEKVLRPTAPLLAAGRSEDVPKAAESAHDIFQKRVEAAQEKAAGSRYPVKIPKAVTSHDMRAAVAEMLPPEEMKKATKKRRKVPKRQLAVDTADSPTGIPKIRIMLVDALEELGRTRTPKRKNLDKLLGYLNQAEHEAGNLLALDAQGGLAW